MARAGRGDERSVDTLGADGPAAGGPSRGPGSTGASQRIDKWLWHARLVKTRTLAAKLVEAGHVRRNRERLTKSSDIVRLGDVLTIALSSRVVVWKITGFAERRGSAPDAARLYEDLTVRSGPPQSDPGSLSS